MATMRYVADGIDLLCTFVSWCNGFCMSWPVLHIWLILCSALCVTRYDYFYNCVQHLMCLILYAFYLDLHLTYRYAQVSVLGEYGGCDPRFCDWRPWGLHEILLYLIMYRNMRWKHFPKW